MAFAKQIRKRAQHYGGNVYQQSRQRNANPTRRDDSRRRPRYVARHVHGLCHRFLRLHHRDAGLPSSFQILDGGDQLSLIKRLLKSLNIAEEIIAPRSLQGFINAQKESGLSASVLSAPDPHTSSMIECYAEYDKISNTQNPLVDFAELMLRSYEMLQSNEILRQHYQNRFNHILVDEFQNPQQTAIRLAQTHGGRKRSGICRRRRQ